MDTAKQEIEKTMLRAVQQLLREHGVRKSTAAIRDAVEAPHEFFSAKEAVLAISALGFKASFGSFDVKNFSEDLLPLIAFKKSGQAVLVEAADDEKS